MLDLLDRKEPIANSSSHLALSQLLTGGARQSVVGEHGIISDEMVAVIGGGRCTGNCHTELVFFARSSKH